MPAIEIGRVCYLERGRNAGTKAIIAEKPEGTIVTVLVGGKRKKCNIRHLFPTKEIVDIREIKEAKVEEKKAEKPEKPKQEKKRKEKNKEKAKEAKKKKKK
ncbi:MAG: 50S ribosomal protein L14e [Candidatus Diapherotrites archaeon]